VCKLLLSTLAKLTLFICVCNAEGWSAFVQYKVEYKWHLDQKIQSVWLRYFVHLPI
jgi:hypothetical protein